MREIDQIIVGFDASTVSTEEAENIILKAKKFIPRDDYQVNALPEGGIVLKHEPAYEIFAGIVANLLTRDFEIEDVGRNERLLKKRKR